MSDASLESLAHAAGIAVTWTDAFGQRQRLAESTLHGLLDAMRWPAHDSTSRHASLQQLQAQERALPSLVTADAGEPVVLPVIPRALPHAVLHHEEGGEQRIEVGKDGVMRAPAEIGYYTVTLGSHRFTLAVAPKRCFSVGDLIDPEKKPRAWGLNAQIYALRHARDGGLGDSHAVEALAQAIGEAGGDALALSPLHAMSPVQTQYSPYSPSHRGFLNWMHADPAQWLGASAWEAAIQQAGIAPAWERARENSLIDWPSAYAMRRAACRALYQQFAYAAPDMHEDLKHFTRDGGARLCDHATIAARQAWAATHNQSTSWRCWDGDWRDRHAASARAFAEAHAEDIQFEIFLQWLAARCWEKTHRHSLDAGQRIGLIRDLAVGFESGGGEAWAYRADILEGLELGAPPDAFNPTGQSWGITAYSPWGLKASGFRAFLELLRANMARAGGIRIDHIIGFRHLWVLPEGAASTAGGYMQLPFEDLLRLVALESWRHRCIVIGEDLGTVPAGLRDTLAARGVLGIDVLLFTRDEKGDFLPPQRWRKQAVATTTTHDLPPLAAWRDGSDIDQLAKTQHWNSTELAQRKQLRDEDITRLQQAVSRQSRSAPEQTGASPRPVFEYLAHTPSPLVLIPLEDALARREQPNLPGTTDAHPNWRHRLPDDTLDALRPVLRSVDTCMQQALPA